MVLLRSRKCFSLRAARTRNHPFPSPLRAPEQEGDEKSPPSPSLWSLLDAFRACGSCRDMDTAKKLHFDAIQRHLQHEIFVATATATMYARCGSMESSRRVFDQMIRRDAIAWTALVTGYVINEDFEQALDLLPRILAENLAGDSRILVALLTACSKLAAASKDGSSVISCLEKGMAIHSLAASSKLDSTEIFVGSALIDMYVKSGSLLDARIVFDRMDRHDVVAWTSLLLGYAESSDDRDLELALEFFHSMLEEQGVDGRLKLSSLERARAIHCLAREHGVEQEIFFAGALVDAFARCGSLEDARRVFERMPCHNMIVLNSLLLGYVENDQAELALSILFSQGDGGKRSWSPNPRTLVGALMACSSIGQQVDDPALKLVSLEKGIAIHREAAKLGLDTSDLFVASTLVDMYSSCGSLADARAVFDRMAIHNVVCWTSLLLGLSENGEPELALELFESMVASSSVLPNARTFRVALSACTSLASKDGDGGKCGSSSKLQQCLERGRRIHRRAMELGHDTDIFVANTLIDMYAKCGGLSDAKLVFNSIGQQQRTPVSWHAMMLGFVENEQHQQALDLLEEMLALGGGRVSSSPLTIVAALMASSGLASLDSGRKLHALACRDGFQSDAAVASSLIDFYGKCGSSMVVAHHVFDSTTSPALPHWNALVSGYSRHGDPARVFELFRELQEEGLDPEAATFLPVLAACSHAGLVDRGTKIFEAMVASSSVAPGIAHYTCVIDMLGRDNRLREAVEMIESMPGRADAAVWTSVLAACKKWKNVEVAKLAFGKIMEVEGKSASPYVLMATIY
ncbi:pentatricopeptide repeat-containing protein At2g03380, mitochondrial-like [Selaginella moellendorffii]|uniref:pentatricopeptide repeat-containing protein At2g03380, mitochondrial-like n=1 Tax=Selaginella moellendorffii TaxID=88036 RepID=UPI000D1C9D76|nr:pentatricopeptide repeat-containing protein At2g03380, mitochondrial-like [Selaginella moellendorffii]|eukprot:XP_024518856.1 pentatricopeptide repeat-containing protein At2g03380, mitochondrial-like [Selaginella moellendorffii]